MREKTTLSSKHNLQDLHAAATRFEAKFDWKAAAEIHTRMMEIIKNSTPRDIASECDIYDRRSECYRMVGDFTAQLADMKSLAALAQELGDFPRQVGALVNQTWALNMKGELDKAYQASKRALTIARQSGDRNLEAAGLYALGYAYRNMGKYSQAREVLDKGYGIARESGNRELEASILNELAFQGLHSGQPDQGRRDGLAALEIFRRIGDREGEAETLIALGLLSTDLAQVRQYQEQALVIFEATGNYNQQGRMWNNLGWNYFQAGLYHRAGEYLGWAIKAARTHESKRSLGYALDSLGAIYFAQGDLQRARSIEEEALALVREIGDRNLEADCHLTLGRILLEDKCASEALVAFQKGLEIYPVSDSPEAAAWLAWMGAAQLALGDIETACEITEQAVALLEAGGLMGRPPQEVWWWRYKALEKHSAIGGQQSKNDAWEALDQAREAILSSIKSLSDDGLRRNYFSKVAINRWIIHEWIAEAYQRGLPLSPLVDHLGGESNLQLGLNRMLEIGVRLGARREEGDLLPFILDEVIELVGGERTVLLLFNKDGEQRNVLTAGFSVTEKKRVFQSKFPEEMASLIDETLRKRVPLLRYRKAGEDGTVTYVKEAGEWFFFPKMAQRSVLCSPLIATGKLVGLVYCELDGIYGHFTRQDLDLLAVLTNQAAMAVENLDWAHTLEERVEERTTELVTVNTISQAAASELKLSALIKLIGDQVRQVFSVDMGYIALYDSETGMVNFPYGYGDTYTLMPFGDGLTSQIIESGETLLINEDSEHRASELQITPVGKTALSFLGVPIISGGKAIGVISVQSTLLEKHFSKADVDLLTTIAANAGVAIYNARLFEEAQLARKAAEAADKAKSDFLANMSHEIRTPMNAIIGLDNLLAKTEMSSKQQDYVEKIGNSARNLLGIINDILDFSKIEAGKLEIENTKFILTEVMDNLSNMIGEKVRDKGLELIFNQDKEIPLCLIGDPLRLGQILLNLTNNAMKFTEKGEIVVVSKLISTKKKEVLLQFDVNDTGIGLTEKQVGKLFQSFSQADTSITRKYGGTGLGLSISKKLSELMGGEIGVRSEYGKGSTFYFTVQLGIGTGKIKVKRTTPDDLKNLKVLVVDDNETAREVLTSYLEDFSLNVKSVPSGDLAIRELIQSKAANDKDYDLVLMDYQMPGLNGIETSRKIREELENIEVPKIVMVTAFGREEIMRQAEKVGLQGFLIKPVSPSMMYDTIMEVFGKSSGLDKQLLNAKEIRPVGFDAIRGAKLLLVEDNEINQQVAKETLEQEGFYVEVAEDGKIGLEKIHADNSYDLVLMDLQMPVMDGYEATIEIRKDERYKDLPIVAMTADAMTGVRDQVKEVGMNDYVTKPIVPKKLWEALTKWIKPGERKLPDRFKEQEKEVSSEIAIPNIDGLDIEKGLSHLRGNKSLYLNLHTKFRDGYGETVKEIKEALRNNDRELAVRLAHTVKGVAGNIGAKEVQEAAGVVEKALKNEEKNEEILAKLDKNLSILVKKLKQTSLDINKPAEDESQKEDIDPDKLKALLKELEPILEKSKPKPAKEIIEKLNSYTLPEPLKPEIEKLSKFVSKYKFKEALEVIDSVLKI